MKQLFSILAKDLQSENFSTREMVIYGVVAPMALVAVCMIASIFN